MSTSDYEINELVERAIEIRSSSNATNQDLIRAEALLKSAFDLRVSVSGRNNINAAYILNELGRTFEREGSNYRAKRAYLDALDIYKEASDKFSNAVLLNNVARVQFNLGEFENASTNRGRAADLALEHARSLSDQVQELREQIAQVQDQVAKLRPGRKAAPGGKVRNLTPHEIVTELDKRIVGQHAAKRKLAIAVSNHEAMMHLAPEERGRIEKSNVVLIGESGTGKTTLMKKLRDVVSVPVFITQATDLTEAGYVGGDVEDIIAKLLKYCNYDVAKAQFAIVFIDEIDKKATSDDSGGRDVSGKGVQKALLTMLEGSTVRVPGKNRQAWVDVDTSNILFIVGGAFEGLTEIVTRRIRSGTTSIGFGAPVGVDYSGCLHETETADLIEFGMIKEILGRLPVIAYLDPLSAEQLTSILTEPEDSLVTQKQILLAAAGTNVKFDDEALAEIADAAKKNKTGGRGLRGIIEEVLEPIMFDQPKGDFTVTAEMVRNRKVAIRELNKRAADTRSNKKAAAGADVKRPAAAA